MAGAAGAGVLGALGAAWWRSPANLSFRPLGIAGFRELDRGTPALSPFLPVIGDPGLAGRRMTPAEACAALGLPAGAVGIAAFYDPQCPVCRKLLPRLSDVAAETGVSLVHHVLTGLGPASENAARATVAARGQGLEAAMRHRLLRAQLVVDAAYVAAVAEGLGADPARLGRDMAAAAVTEELVRSASLARALGILGTPATVIGRTLVSGDMGMAEIIALIERERAEVFPGPCS